MNLGRAISCGLIKRRRHFLRQRQVQRFVERLEDRRVLAVVPFSPQIVVDDLDADGPDRVFAADIDGDGDVDALIASYRDSRISWYENIDGQRFEQHLVAVDAVEARDVIATDVDGDGDLDIVAAAYGADRIQWYENQDSHGTFGSRRVITEATNGVLALDAADLDADGDIDLVSASWFDDKVAWYENTGNGVFAEQQVITNATDGARSIKLGDINNDNRPDIFVASRLDDTLSWIPNLGSGNFGSPVELSFTANGPEHVELADIDADGDLDAIVATFQDNTIAWFENLDQQGTFGTQNIVSTTAENGQYVVVADVDGDGDQDLVSASYFLDEGGFDRNKVVWYPNLDGQGSFGAERFVTSDAAGVESVAVADINRDGANDLLVASAIDNKVTYFRNLGTGSFAAPVQVLSDPGGAASGHFADIDADGDLDIVTAAYWDNSISWYENLDRSGTYSREKTISTIAQRAQSVRTADLDGDGDIDVISASYRDGKIAWYPNEDGRGTFGAQRVLERLNGAVHIHVADFDGDGLIDIASASAGDGIVAWYKNLGGGEFDDIAILTRRAFGAEWVSSADVDGDGDLDLLNASFGDGELSWFENIGGAKLFSAAKIIPVGGGPTTIEAMDVDGDGDADLVATLYTARSIIWVENLGEGQFGDATTVAENLPFLEALTIADVDSDGSEDIVVGGDRFVIWYERLSDGTFVSRSIGTQVNRVFDVDTGDVNDDGTLDVISASFYDNKIALYLNGSIPGDFDGDRNVDEADINQLCLAIRTHSDDAIFDLTADGKIDGMDRDHLVQEILGTTIGDANLDLVFDSQDLVAVFIAGQYEDRIENNSIWSSGDWDCDGDFNTDDIVLSFIKGGYTTPDTTAAIHSGIEWSELAAAMEADAIDKNQRRIRTS